MAKRIPARNVLDILDCDESDVEGYIDDSDDDEDFNPDNNNEKVYHHSLFISVV